MAKHETVAALPSDYNLKLGPVLLNTNATIGAEFNDNIGLTNSGAKSDFILTPQVGVSAQWPITASNTLTLSTSIGYSKYLIHPQYDTGNVLLSPDSALSFDVYVGDFKINIHDQFSYQDDPIGVGGVSNVVTFSRFQNTAGIGVVWDLNKLILTLNYDHINFISDDLQTITGSDLADPGNLTYSADQVSASAAYSITSTVRVGIEGAASARNYNVSDIDDDQLSVGPFLKIDVTPNFEVAASGGYQVVSTDSGNLTAAQVNRLGTASPVLGAGTTNSYYANLTLDHRLNKYYTDHLTLGHELQVDVFSQQTDITYVTYTSSWKVNKSLNLAFTLNFEDVSSPSAANAISATNYDQVTAAVQANFPVTRRISGSVLYQFNNEFNTQAGQGYTQNRIGLILNYHF